MARLPKPGGDSGNWGNVLNDFLLQAHNSDGTLKPSAVGTAGAADDATVVHTSGAETISGTKTFQMPVVVPTPTQNSHATTKAYVDAATSAGAPDATDTNKGLVQLGGDLAGTATAPTVPALSGKADNLSVVHLSGAETLGPGTKTFSAHSDRSPQLLFNSTNDPNGYIARNLEFHMDGALSRPGPVWVDQNGRTQVWTGWHDTIPSGSSHHGWEIKSATDPAGSYPDVLATRFRVKSDADQTQAAFYNTSMLYIENGIASPNTQFGITFNTPITGSVVAGTATGGNYTLGKLTVSADASGVATMDIAPGLANSTGAKLRLFRDTNTASASLAVYAADGTNTLTHYIDAKTGSTQQYGKIRFYNSATEIYNIVPTLDVSSNTIIENDILTANSTANAKVRFFRNTNTTGTKLLSISKGDGTNTDTLTINANTGQITLLGTGGIAMNATKITNIANGTAATDAAAFGQIPTALPPSGTAGGDLTGTYPSPTLAVIGTAGTYSYPASITTDDKGRVTSVTTGTAGLSNPMTTQGDLIYGGSSGVASRLAAGSSNQVLSGGTSPTWGAVALGSMVSGTLSIANGGTGSTTQNFVDLTNNQTVAGVKTFSSAPVLNAGASSTGAISPSASTTYDLGSSSLRWSTLYGRNINLSAGITIGTVGKTSAYTLTSGDSVVFGTATGGPFTLTLPTAVGISGRQYTIKKVDSSANAVTVGTTGSETIDGATTYTLSSQYKYVTVISDNTKWLVIGNN